MTRARRLLPLAAAFGITGAYSSFVWSRSEDLSGSTPAPDPVRVEPARDGVLGEPVLDAAPIEAVRIEPAAEPIPVERPQRERPRATTRATTRETPRQATRSLLRELSRARTPGERLAALDRGGALLAEDERAALLARALDATPPTEATLREAIVERLSPLAAVAPARDRLTAIVELSPVREERLAALRALARAPAPLALEARSSIAAAARDEDALVALEAQSVLAFTSRRDGLE